MQVGSAFPLLHCPPGLSAEVIHLRIQGPHIPKLLREIKNPPMGSSVLVALGSVSAALGFFPNTHPRGVWHQSPVPVLDGSWNVHNARSWISLSTKIYSSARELAINLSLMSQETPFYLFILRRVGDVCFCLNWGKTDITEINLNLSLSESLET